MQPDENQSLRWLVREGEPISLNLYRAMRQVERLTPEQLRWLADGMDAVSELRRAAGITGMTTRAAVDAGLLSETQVYGAFGLAAPERRT
jgi:hypothetical protein